MHALDVAGFKKYIYNYDINKEWKYEGDLPAVIDFYADWCGPCRMLMPTMEAFSREFEGKLHIYKINVDENLELARLFGIKTIPSLLFIPVGGTEKPEAIQDLEAKPRLIKTLIEEKLITATTKKDVHHEH